MPDWRACTHRQCSRYRGREFLEATWLYSFERRSADPVQVYRRHCSIDRLSFRSVISKLLMNRRMIRQFDPALHPADRVRSAMPDWRACTDRRCCRYRGRKLLEATWLYSFERRSADPVQVYRRHCSIDRLSFRSVISKLLMNRRMVRQFDPALHPADQVRTAIARRLADRASRAQPAPKDRRAARTRRPPC